MGNLILIFPDQMNEDSAALDRADPRSDTIWMVEPGPGHLGPWPGRLRLAYLHSTAAHLRERLREKGFPVTGGEAGAEAVNTAASGKGMASSGDTARPGFRDKCREVLSRIAPRAVVAVPPGDHGSLADLQDAAAERGIPLELREDPYVMITPGRFNDYAGGREKLVLEHFYRHMRREHGILIGGEGRPEGGKWNFDAENRRSFGKEGPQKVPAPHGFLADGGAPPGVSGTIRDTAPPEPGTGGHWNPPVTREKALALLDDFIRNRLPLFGAYQDAMWSGEPFLYHSLLSAPLNCRLLSPRECIGAALAAHREGTAPLNSVEAFIRQIIGWREFIRGIYWTRMPEYRSLNYFDHRLECPGFYWDGRTDMNCVRQALEAVLAHGYAHHIQRLMVLGLFALLMGVDPEQFHQWHMSMYVDAVEWASLPNILGMSQYADGGLVATKPYCAGGGYINRMSNHCRGCVYDHRRATGPLACPFTVLYWDFLNRHQPLLKGNGRMKIQLINLERKRLDREEMKEIRGKADTIRERCSGSAEARRLTA